MKTNFLIGGIFLIIFTGAAVAGVPVEIATGVGSTAVVAIGCRTLQGRSVIIISAIACSLIPEAVEARTCKIACIATCQGLCR